MQIRNKWIGTGGIALIMVAILSQFQNCAPAGVANEPVSADSSPEMRVIEDWSSRKISFIDKVLQPSATEKSLAVQGFCDRKMEQNEPLRWQISVPQAQEALLAGAVGCEGGGFHLLISELQQLRCGMAYQLEISTLNGETDQAVLIRNCTL